MKIQLLLVGLWVLACAPAMTEKDKSAAKIRYDIGVTAFNEGDTLGALRELLGAVESDPEFAEAQHALGLVYYAMGRRNDALHHYQQAIKLQPKFSEAQNNLGVLLIELERYDEAIAAFKVALADILYPTPFYAEGNLGWAYYKKGDTEVALRHLRNAVATNPKFCRGYGWLADIALDTQQPDQAVAYGVRFKKQCLDDPKTAAFVPQIFAREMSYKLGRGYLALGDQNKAKEALQSCASAGDDDEIGIKCAGLLAGLN